MKPHAAILASPGMGHLIPVLELGKRMATQHGFRVTVFVVGTDSAPTSLLKSSNLNINLHVVQLPPVEISGIVDPDASIVTKLVVIVHQSLPLLRSAISSMKSRPTALVVDLFGTAAFNIADEFEMLRYLFDTSNAWFLAVTIYAPTLDKKALNEHMLNHKPMQIPRCKSLRYEDTLEPFQDRSDPVLEGFFRLGLDIPKADGILVNTWTALEASTLAALADPKALGLVARVPVYPIGPLARKAAPAAPNASSGNIQLMDWLNKQAAESVIYVSFGSGGTLSAKQTTELAWGLEQSQQRFIWVVRPSVENDASSSYFTAGARKGNSDGTPDYLPDGFLSRTRDVGIVVPIWSPQAEILSHPAVGGFLSHCGWNSTLESIQNGVPMISWPLYAEQKMNAAMLTEEIGVAVRPKASASSGVVERKEIETMVRKVMADKEGRTIRSRMKGLKSSAEKALSKEGSSYKALSMVAEQCVQHMKANIKVLNSV